ncbi:MAG: hypothetical protein BMS9Abin05_1211 [Rhodothermia bacterium]|nr:MAG: hypothetical protein BMS9Abin05_1211 [Rhodothermia bacterium]
MDSVYLISLIVGGFFVVLSIFGGSEHEANCDVDTDFDAGFDVDANVEHDFNIGGSDLDVSTDVGFVDLFSLRALFLFAAFFGLTGSLFTWFGVAEPMTALLSTLTGMVVGLGGNYVIKKFAYEQISSNVTVEHLRGKTGHVLLPFGPEDRGKIVVEAKGQRLQLTAKSIAADPDEQFEPGEEIVIVRIDGRVAEVIKPN